VDECGPSDAVTYTVVVNDIQPSMDEIKLSVDEKELSLNEK
jgi:hypothetical protein